MNDSVVYMDPPYQGVCGNRDTRYLASVQFCEFVEVLETLNRRNIRHIVSYDGRTGSKVYGVKLPEHLNLTHMELDAGRSTQATLLGRDDATFEALYLSPALTLELAGEKRSTLIRTRNSSAPHGGEGMTNPRLPQTFVALCKKVTAKRARTVIAHILEHGFITTDELKTQSGYDHPPRASRDVREQGIPLVPSKVSGANGRKIAA